MVTETKGSGWSRDILRRRAAARKSPATLHQDRAPIYTEKTVAYEERIRDRFLEANGKKLPADCYVSISIRAVFEIPKSYTNQRKADCASGIERPAKKPDADNITKAVLDALNGVAYDDDKQVTSVRCTKRYTNSVSKLGLLERPGLVISVIEDKI